MDYLQRLTVLKHLYEEISLQLAMQLTDHSDLRKINGYHQILKQIDAELEDIQQMRIYQTTTARSKLRN